MKKQITLSAFSDELASVRTKKKEFLSQIERIVPWGEWIEEIRPCYYKGERGNKPYDLELMLRLYVLQNLYDLSDMATVAEVIDSRAFLNSAEWIPATKCRTEILLDDSVTYWRTTGFSKSCLPRWCVP